mmetsp:Transcript_78910/g.241486  ORF Transcript_78910/g.241486 Transcript_78910/m.241486 type:complete len:248 (-) Transcript_78910:6-749(-)
MVAETQVHGTLAMAETRRGAIRRRHIQVVTARDEVHVAPSLRAAGDERGADVSILLLQVHQDDTRFEHSHAVRPHQSWHFLQRVDPGEFLSLQVLVSQHLRLDEILHAGLVPQPQADARRVVRVYHVEKHGLTPVLDPKLNRLVLVQVRAKVIQRDAAFARGALINGVALFLREGAIHPSQDPGQRGTIDAASNVLERLHQGIHWPRTRRARQAPPRSVRRCTNVDAVRASAPKARTRPPPAGPARI